MTTNTDRAVRARALLFYIALFAMLALAFTASVSAQTINIANPASKEQTRWVVAPMPLSQAAALPAACLANGKYPAYKAQQLGVTTQLWHIKCTVPAKGTLSLTTWAPIPPTIPPTAFTMTPWVLDNPNRVVMRLVIYEGNVWKSNIELKAGTMVRSSQVSQTWEFRGNTGAPSQAARGYTFTLWTTFWEGQDAVDMEGVAIWSNPLSPSWSQGNVKLDLVSGAWPIDGEPFSLYNAAPNGFAKWNKGYTIYRGMLPHGVGIAFRGVILPVDDSPLPISFEDQDKHLNDADRARLEAAAAEAPLVAACDWTQSPNDWMAFGEVPRTTQRANPTAVIEATQRAGGYFDPRPYANHGKHDDTGDQLPFGATKDLIALQGDPWRVYELQDSALDYWRRAAHHRELDGRRVTKAIRPGVQTWQMNIEPRMSPDTFGKPGGSNNYVPDLTIGLRHFYADDQHRGDAYTLCGYALSGSPLLLECIHDMITVDEMRAMPARGWFDAPRATGRLMQSWAKIATITNGADRDLALSLGLAELADRQRDQDKWHYNPVRVVEWKDPDPRVLSGARFSVPWNDGLCVLGALEERRAFIRLGRLEDAEKFTEFAAYLGTSIIKWSTVTDSRTGDVLPINGLKWLDGGAANPASYYVYPRAGAATDNAVDMLVGSLGWWKWYSGPLFVAKSPSLNVNVDDRAKAEAIWQRTVTNPDLSTLEWTAVK